MLAVAGAVDLGDGEGLLLRVLADAHHEQHLRREQQAALLLLARASHEHHVQGHVHFRPAQRLKHLPVAKETSQPRTEARLPVPCVPVTARSCPWWEQRGAPPRVGNIAA